jgi:hypothetical protein
MKILAGIAAIGSGVFILHTCIADSKEGLPDTGWGRFRFFQTVTFAVFLLILGATLLFWPSSKQI